MLQMEECKAEVEKKLSVLVKIIRNNNKIPKVTKKELLGVVNDLDEQCQLLCSDLGTGGGKGGFGSASSSRSSSDLDYYSSEELDMGAGNASETLSLDCAAMLRKIQETDLTNEDLKKQVSNLKQDTEFLRDQNMELAGDIGGKRNEDRVKFKGLVTNAEAALLLNQKRDLELLLEKKNSEVVETRIRLKRLEEEIKERTEAELKIVEEKQSLWNKVQKLEDMKSKFSEIDHLREENHKLHARTKEHEDIIQQLSMEIKDQQKLVKEQKATIDKFSEVQSFGPKLNTDLLERKMEELAQDFRMKVEDHLRILYRRIHVAEQLHLESKEDYVKTQPRENRVEASAQLEKMKEMVERGLAGPEMAIKKVKEGNELVTRLTRLTKEIDSAKKWVHEKNNRTKHEVETLQAKLECREAQESLLKEKLSKLEAKLGQEATGKLSLPMAMRRIKKLEINVKERDVDLLILGEQKREAIRQLCVLVDYQRCRYEDLKTSVFKLALQA